MKKLHLVLRATLFLALFCGVAAAQPTVDLRINSISGVPSDITLGQGDVTYTIDAYNNSSDTATNPVLAWTLPTMATLFSATPSSGGNCTPTPAVSCTWTDHPGFTFRSVTLVVTPGAGGPRMRGQPVCEMPGRARSARRWG